MRTKLSLLESDVNGQAAESKLLSALEPQAIADSGEEPAALAPGVDGQNQFRAASRGAC